MSRQFCDILNNSFPERARIPHFKLYLQCLKKLLINKRDFLYFKLTDRNNKAGMSGHLLSIKTTKIHL